MGDELQTAAVVSVEISAAPETVYAVLTDLSRISEISPECYRAEWEGEPAAPEVGATIHGYNRNGTMEWDARAVVVAAVPSRLWAFEVPADDGRSTAWRYVIEPAASGCRVTQSFDAPVLDGAFFQKIGRYDLLVANLEESVQRLKAVAEAE